MNLYWIGILVGGGIVLVLAIWGILQFVQQDKIFQNQQDKMLQNGVRVVGRITEHRENFSLLRGDVPFSEYYIRYSYEYEGKKYTQEQIVSKEAYITFPDETKVNVHFMPDDPAHCVMNFDEGSK